MAMKTRSRRALLDANRRHRDPLPEGAPRPGWALRLHLANELCCNRTAGIWAQGGVDK
jgi:hypothetical protein